MVGARFDRTRPVLCAGLRPWGGCLVEDRQHSVPVGRCHACGRVFHPWAEACPHCLSSQVRVDTVPGSGTVYSFSVVHRGTSSRFSTATPYVLALVELAPRLRVLSNIVGAATDRLSVGSRVSLCTEAGAEDGERLLFCLDDPASPDEEVPRGRGSLAGSGGPVTAVRPAIALVGVGETSVGRLHGSDPVDLARLAAGRALDDAGLALADVDGLICAGSLVGDMYMYNARLAARLHIAPRYSSVLPLGGTSFTHAITEAGLVIEAGLADTVLVVAADTLLSGLGPQVAIDRFESFQDECRERPYGFMMPAVYAMAARRHMHLYGTTREQLAQVAVSARRHAALNPLAQYRRPLSVADVVGAVEVATPLGLFDCSPISDGAGAFVVTARDRAAHLAKRPIHVLAASEAHALEYDNADRDLTSSAAAEAGRAVWTATGLTPHDVDLAEIYDCFTITVLVTLEDLGFCPKGESGSFVEGGAIEIGGALPVNTHGGLLSHGHPGTPAGIFHVIEAVKQLRGEVEPERQVEGVELALVSGNAGMLRDSGVVLLGREPLA